MSEKCYKARDQRENEICEWVDVPTGGLPSPQVLRTVCDIEKKYGDGSVVLLVYEVKVRAYVATSKIHIPTDEELAKFHGEKP